MAMLHKDLSPIVHQLPNLKEALKELFEKSESFRELCEDYRLCREAFDFWNQQDKPSEALRRDEYAMLLQTLESEIIQQLDENA